MVKRTTGRKRTSGVETWVTFDDETGEVLGIKVVCREKDRKAFLKVTDGKKVELDVDGTTAKAKGAEKAVTLKAKAFYRASGDRHSGAAPGNFGLSVGVEA